MKAHSHSDIVDWSELSLDKKALSMGVQCVFMSVCLKNI